MSEKFLIEITAEDKASDVAKKAGKNISESVSQPLNEVNQPLKQSDNLLGKVSKGVSAFDDKLKRVGVKSPLSSINKTLKALSGQKPQSTSLKSEAKTESGVTTATQATKTAEADAAGVALRGVTTASSALVMAFGGLGFLVNKLASGFGKTSTEIGYGALEANLTTRQYQQLLNVGELLGVKPVSMKQSIVSLNETARQSILGLNPQAAYGMNVLGVKLPKDVRDINTAKLFEDVLSAVNRPDISSITKMQVLRSLGLDTSLLRYASLTEQKKEWARKSVEQSILSPEQINKGINLDISQKLLEQSWEGAKNQGKGFVAPMAEWFNNTGTSIIQSVIGETPTANEMYSNLGKGRDRPYPSEVPELLRLPSIHQELNRPKGDVLRPPLLPMATPQPQPQQEQPKIDIHITNTPLGAKAEVRINKQPVPATIHHSTVSGINQ